MRIENEHILIRDATVEDARQLNIRWNDGKGYEICCKRFFSQREFQEIPSYNHGELVMIYPDLSISDFVGIKIDISQTNHPEALQDKDSK